MTRTTLAGLLAGLALVAACGSDPEPVAEPASEPAPTTTEAEFSEPDADPPAEPEAIDDAAVEAEPTEAEETYPSRIVSLSPTATEMLYAIGAGDQVIAVDDFSNYPADTADKMPGISGVPCARMA